MRLRSRFALIGSVALAVGLSLSESPPPASAETEERAAPGGPSYTGAGSCGSSTCHGSPRPRTQFRVRQDESTIWASGKDKHAKAWRNLQNERSVQIARNLHLPKPAQETPRCLDCHALTAPTGRRGAAFEIKDGVSCEACHGPAEKWLGPHTTRGWTHEQSIEAGMVDTRNVVVRARRCLACHLGDDTKSVDHELIAAGHPDLFFELDAFSAGMPAHWKEGEDKGPWFSVRAWAVGQAVALRESMKLLQQRASGAGGSWPEFAEYECFACHHDLTRESKDSWRQARGYEAKAGQPPWNAYRHAMLGALLRQVAPAQAEPIEADLRSLGGLMASGAGEKSRIAQTAGRIAGAIDPLIERLAAAAAPTTAEGTRDLLRGLLSDADALAYAGYRTAEQVYLALDSLYRPLARNAKPSNDAAIREGIDRLLGDLEDFSCRDPRRNALKSEKPAAPCPDAKISGAACYDPRGFAAHLKDLQKLL